MSKKLILTVAVLLVVTCILLSALAVLSGDNKQTPDMPDPSISSTINYEQKSPYGVAGFTPEGFPAFSFSKVKQFWDDVEPVSGTYGVHINIDDDSVINLAGDGLDIPILLVIDHKNIDDLDKLYEILDKYPQITYLGAGNEINLVDYDHPEEYQEFKDLAQTVFPEIKQKHPDINLFTVFQFESLIGKAFITGKEYENSINLVSEWEPLVDMIGLTIYPYFDYGTPAEIPDNYLDPITAITTKPLVITETAWPSNITAFSDSPYAQFNTTESEQLVYLDWLSNMEKAYQPKVINWLFLNDVDSGNPVFNGSGLRNNDTSPKPAYDRWVELVEESL